MRLEPETAPKTPLERWYLEGSESCPWSPYRARVDTGSRRLQLDTTLEVFRRGLSHPGIGPWSSNTSPTGSFTDCEEVLHTAAKFESIQFFREETVKVLEEALPLTSANTRSYVVDFDKCPTAYMPSGYGKLTQPYNQGRPRETKRGILDSNIEESRSTCRPLPAKRVKTSTPEQEIFYLSCPFVKHNGDRYNAVNNACTQRPGFADTKRLSTHLRRVHLGCLSCRKAFDNTDKLQKHRSAEACSPVEEQEDQPELMTEEQEKMFDKRFDKGTTIIEKYRGWYQALWPDDPRGSTIDPRYDYLVRNPSPVIYRNCKELAPGHSTWDGSKQVMLSATTDARLVEEVHHNLPAKSSDPEPADMVAEQAGTMDTERTPDIQSGTTAQGSNESGNEVGKKLSEKDLSDTSLPSLLGFNCTEDTWSVSNLASPHPANLVPSHSGDTAGKLGAVIADSDTQLEQISYGPGLSGTNEGEYGGLEYDLSLMVDDDESDFFYMRS